MKAGDEQMVEPPAAPVAGERPARLALAVAVQLAEGVGPALLAQPVDQGALGAVPALPALGSQLAGARVGEGEHVAVGELAAGRVEVAAQDPGSLARVQIGRDRLVGADLGEVRRGRDRGVDVDHLGAGARGAAEHALRPGEAGRRGERGQRLAGGGEHAERPAPPGRGVLDRGLCGRQPGTGERVAPQRQRARGHLLERDHVGTGRGHHLRLLGLSPHPARDVPRQHPHGAHHALTAGFGERSRDRRHARIVGRMRSRLRQRLAESRLPAPERRAAQAERRAEAAIAAEREPAVCLAELHRAAIEAERRRWLGPYGEWRF